VLFKWEKPPNYDYVSNTLPGWITDKYYWYHWKDPSGGKPCRRIYYDDSDFPGLTDAQKNSIFNTCKSVGIISYRKMG
jgi:hypothetical protein